MAMRKYAAVIGILAGVAAIDMGLYIHSAQPKLGPSWHVFGILAGYALAQSVKAYDEPPDYDEEPAPPPSGPTPPAGSSAGRR